MNLGGFLINTATLLSFAISVLIPALSSLLAKQKWPAEVVGLLTLALATVNGFLTQWAVDPDGYDWRKGALAAVGSYIVAAVARKQLWAGTKTDAKLLAVGSKPA